MAQYALLVKRSRMRRLRPMPDLREFRRLSILPDGGTVLHVMEGPIKAGPYWWARCSCGWQADPQETHQAAGSLHCGIEEEELRSHRNEFRFHRHQYADRE